MIALLLALGLLEPPAGNTSGSLIAPADQIGKVAKLPTLAVSGAALPLGATVWQRPFAPADRRPYAWDFSEVLGDTSKVAYIERLTMSAAGAAAGVQIDQSAGRLPVITTDGKHVQVWFKVDPAHQGDDVFAGAGIQVGIAALISTDDDPFQEDERTLVLTVRRL